METEIIRNGGFERGNMAFWESLDVTSIEALAAAKKYGSYGCKMISEAANYGLLISRDLVSVSFGEILDLSYWIKNSATETVSMFVYEYDSDKNYMGFSYLPEISVGTEFTKYSELYKCKAGISYIKIAIMQLEFLNGEYSYIDSVSVIRLNLPVISTTIEKLIEVENDTSKHTVTGAEFFTGIWKEAEYHYYLTNFTETGGANTVTLDVKIETYNPIINRWYDTMVFQQGVAGPGGGLIFEETKTLVGTLGWKQRVSYTTAGAGTIGDCDFKVGVVYKR